MRSLPGYKEQQRRRRAGEREIDPPASLRLHPLESERYFSLSFEGDLRALFRYGDEKQPGDAHIVWER